MAAVDSVVDDFAERGVYVSTVRRHVEALLTGFYMLSIRDIA